MPVFMKDFRHPGIADGLRLAVERAQTQAALAGMLGLSQSAISKRLAKREGLEAEEAIIVERELGISRHLLRPDLYPLEERGTSVVDRLNGARA